MSPQPGWIGRKAAMTARPLSISIISWIFIATGGITLLAGLLPLTSGITASQEAIAGVESRGSLEFVLALVIRLLAVIGGAYMLRGSNWARWLLVAWMGYHLVISIFHSGFELIMHGLIFGVIIFVLFRPVASVYFRSGNAGSLTPKL